MKKILRIFAVFLGLYILSGCGCRHDWAGADCVTAKSCSLCGETEGAPLGHDWAAADCEAARTCRRCGETEGTPLAHNWIDATCETPRICALCNIQDGDPPGHCWADWTRIGTDAHRVCESCDSEEVITMTDYLLLQHQGRWISTRDLESDIHPDWYTSFEIRNDGTVCLHTPDGTYPSCKLEYNPPNSASKDAFREELQHFILTAEGADEPFNFFYIPQEDFILGYLGFTYEREPAEHAAVRKMLVGNWVLDSFYCYDDSLAGPDRSGYTVEFFDNNTFTANVDTVLRGRWVYYSGNSFHIDDGTCYIIVLTVDGDYWSTNCTLSISPETGIAGLTLDRPRVERTTFAKEGP